MSFYNLGDSKGQKDIEANDALNFDSETKPYSFKAPTHLIESIDIISNEMGTSRNLLINQILSIYLVDAFSEFTNGYMSNFTPDKNKSDGQILLEQLESALSKGSYSKNATDYLTEQVINFISLHKMSENQEPYHVLEDL